MLPFVYNFDQIHFIYIETTIMFAIRNKTTTSKTTTTKNPIKKSIKITRCQDPYCNEQIILITTKMRADKLWRPTGLYTSNILLIRGKGTPKLLITGLLVPNHLFHDDAIE